MKHCLYSVLFLLSITYSSFAQKPITLQADSSRIGNTVFPGFWLTIPEVKPEVVKNNWTKTILKGTKSKISGEYNEMTLFGAIIPDIMDGNINIMSKIEDADSATRLFVCIEKSRDNFVLKSSAEYERTGKFLRKFAREQYAALTKKQVDSEDEKLRDLEKELKSVRRDKEKLEKDIQSAQVAITQANDDIASYNKELDILAISIDNASTLLSTMPDDEQKKTKQSELKDLQKKKKGIMKDINSAENKITKSNTRIDDDNRDISLNMVSQNDLLERIKQQKINIQQYNRKLKIIEAYQ